MSFSPGDPSRDELTGLANHRHLHRVLGEEVDVATRTGRPLALILVDLDDFRHVNAQLGHLAGDSALRSFADRMRQVARPRDVTCRFGGEEFAVLLPESTLDEARQFSARLDERLVSDPISALRTTASYGIVELEDGEDKERFLVRADLALYEAKKGPPPPGALGVREPRRPKPSSGGAPVRKLLGET